MHRFNLYTRRAFLDQSFKLTLGVALSTLVNIPFVMKRALAEGNIGLPGPDGKVKKLLFIFLRGANDALNSVIPIEDPAYALSTTRPTTGIGIAKDTENAINYADTGPCLDLTQWTLNPNTRLLQPRTATDPTYSYDRAIDLGTGFAALHPSLKFLAPVYNAGDLVFVHRVGYPNQSRSHFDSQNYWESGAPNNNLVRDGIFYRTILESGLANKSPLTAVSVQSALPLILRGSAAAMTNLADPARYDLLGVPNTTAGNLKADQFFATGNLLPTPDRKNRELLALQFQNLSDTLQIFSQIPFSAEFYDNENTDQDAPYNLFPTSAAQNGGAPFHGGDSAKYVVDNSTSAYTFFKNLKAAALILNKTDAIIAGTEFGGFDTHSSQGGVTGAHANLLRRLAWAIYALRKYFLTQADRCTWDNLVIVTLSEFGRTTVQNSSGGTDHAEGGLMLIAGGGVRGYGKNGSTTGVFGCSPSEFSGANADLNWVPGPRTTNPATCGTMWAANVNVTQGYLKRQTDYRSVLGEIIRKHLGATQSQLNRIIPGYNPSGDKPEPELLSGGLSSVDGTKIRGEVGFLI
ncbi:MAG: DUF1501 domain-containing protein [Verrucomicrobiae bacterium]|nr:DUF1501 domain-containing protein [Verrucomicrobiae bacterium]